MKSDYSFIIYLLLFFLNYEQDVMEHVHFVQLLYRMKLDQICQCILICSKKIVVNKLVSKFCFNDSEDTYL